MEIIGLLFLGFMGAAIYGMVTRKSKCIFRASGLYIRLELKD